MPNTPSPTASKTNEDATAAPPRWAQELMSELKEQRKKLDSLESQLTEVEDEVDAESTPAPTPATPKESSPAAESEPKATETPEHPAPKAEEPKAEPTKAESESKPKPKRRLKRTLPLLKRKK